MNFGNQVRGGVLIWLRQRVGDQINDDVGIQVDQVWYQVRDQVRNPVVVLNVRDQISEQIEEEIK